MAVIMLSIDLAGINKFIFSLKHDNFTIIFACLINLGAMFRAYLKAWDELRRTQHNT